ncbi:MAG: hypothetical protein RLZZ381_1333 [Cyanobacteriota bacterium]|jgi:hypothetical protein
MLSRICFPISYDFRSQQSNKIKNKLKIKLFMTTVLSNPISKTTHYQTNQQVKYLHLEAEVDMLLQKLNVLRQRKQLTELPSKIS